MRVGRKLEITNKNRMLEDENIKYNLNIYTNEGVVIKKNVDRSILVSKDELLETVQQGSDVSNENYKIYSMSLRNQEEILKAQINHRGIGWDLYKGKKIFKHTGIIARERIQSTYQGEVLIETKGTLDDYRTFLIEEVLGHTPLEAAIALGLSAVVVSYLDGYKSNVFSIYGNSTTGKTTAGELIVGLGTRPTTEENSLMMSWSSTQNALIGKIRDNNGCPILIDDSSLSSIKDFSVLIYRFESGKDKERMNKESELKEARTWKTAIISTGECSLLENSNQNEGIKVRFHEFGDVGWTQSAEHSNRIKRRVQEVYGHGVQVVASKLLSLSDEAIYSLLKHFEDRGRIYLEQRKKTNHLTERILKVYATVRLAIELFAGKLKLDFNMVEIEHFLLNHMFADQRPMWEIALEKLLGHVENNINKFSRDVIYDISPNPVKLKFEAKSYNDLLGKISDIELVKNKDKADGTKRVKREILMLEGEFYKTMKELGFNNSKGILKNMKENDVLNAENDRYTRTRKISESGNQVKVIVIKIEVDYIETEDMRTAYCKTRKQDKEQTKNISSYRTKRVVTEVAEKMKGDIEKL